MNKPLRIAHLITTLQTGGAETMLLNLISRKSGNAKCRPSVISLTGRGVLSRKFEQCGIPVCHLEFKGRLSDIRELFRLYRILRKQQPDILQTWLYHADLIGLLAGRLSRVKRIVWNIRCSVIDFAHYAWSTRLIVKMLTWLSHCPDAIITNSRAGARYHRLMGYRAKQWVVLPNGFDVQKYRPDPEAGAKFKESIGIKPETKLIGMVARYDSMKDFKCFIQAAYHMINHNHPDLNFVLIGEKVNRLNPELQRLIQKYQVGHRFYTLGRQTDLKMIYPALDIHTLTSKGEGFPNVVGEAMACGVACVATDVGDVNDIMGDTGISVPYGDSKALAKAWRELLSRPGENRRQLGLLARKRIADLYSIETVQRQYQNFYCELAGI